MVTVRDINKRRGIRKKNKTRSDEEVARDRIAGQTFIKEREKIASKTGVNIREATAQIGAREAPAIQSEVAARQVQETRAQQSAEATAIIEARQAGLPEDVVQPEEVKDRLLPDAASFFPPIGIARALQAGAEGDTSGRVSEGLKALGGAAALGVGAAAIAGGLSIGAEALAVNSARTTITANVAARSTGILSLAKSKAGSLIGSVVGLFGVSKIIGIPTARIRSIDTSLSQIRETITAPVAAVRNEGMTPSEGFDSLDDMESAVSEYERSLQTLAIYSLDARLNPELIGNVKERISKLKFFIRVAKRDIANFQANPQGPNTEQIALLLREIERGGV